MTVAAGRVTTGPAAPAPSQAGASGPAEAPRLADGVELLGEYKNSGYGQPPSLVRRADGQVVQLSRLLYLVTCRIDGCRDPAAIAALVAEELGRALPIRCAISSRPSCCLSASSRPRAPRPPRRRLTRCSPSGHGARSCPNGRRTPPERSCGRCSGDPWSRPWPAPSWPWTTGCSPSTGWAAGFSRSCTTRWTCSLCSASPCSPRRSTSAGTRPAAATAARGPA